MHKIAIFGLFLLFLVNVHTPAAAVGNAFPPNQLITCNSSLEYSPCSSYGDAQLLQQAQALFTGGTGSGMGDPWQNPGEPGFSIVTGEVQFIIVDVATGNVSRVIVQRFGEGFNASLQLNHVTPLPSDINIANAAVELENTLVSLRPKLTFSQNSAGVFVNSQNQTIAQLFGSGNFPASAVLNLPACPTAYAWELHTVFDPTVPRCRPFLRGLVEGWMTEIHDNQTIFGSISTQVANFNATINFGVITLQAVQQAILVEFNMDDGSRLVLRVTDYADGIPTIEVDQKKSLNAEGDTFEEFKNSLNAGSQVEMSWFETIGMFGNYSCGPQLQATGDVYQRFRVEILEKDSMGRPSRVRIVLIEQFDIIEETITCNFV